MAQADIAILEFGSSKVTVIIARRGINNVFDIKGQGIVEYAGFCDGEFLEPELLRTVVHKAITSAESAAHAPIKDLYVGVPGEFTVAVTKNASGSFKSRQRITSQNLEDLFDSEDTFRHDPDFVVINRSPIYYLLDDNRRVVDPVNMQSAKLGGMLSYILAERRFIKKINGILSEYNLDSVEFVSSVLAESLYVFEPDMRDRFVLFADIGYLTTSLVLARGDGILYMKSFSVGGGHIEADLATCLEIPFEEAQELKKKVALSLDVDDTDQYDIATKDGVISFPARTVHDIVAARLENIASLIQACLEGCAVEYPDYIPLHLLGGGVSYVRGAREYLAKFLNKSVEPAKSNIPHCDKPNQASEYGLLDVALKSSAPKRSFWSKIFG